jgi:hypothetical protein
LVALHLHSRLLHGVNLDLQISEREDQIPVRLFDLRNDFNGALAKLRIRQRKILLGDLDGAAVVVEAQAA